MMIAKNMPQTAKINDRDHLEIGGCDTVSLAQEYGTPLYILDEATIRDRCRQYLTSFRKYYPETDIVFACKSLCTAGVLKIIKEEGLGLDVSSGGEIYTAMKAGCDLGKVYFHGNNKSVPELELALKNGVGRIVLDNQQESVNLGKVAEKLGKRANVLLRINPGIEAHTHEYIKTAKIDSKFGVSLDQVESTVKVIRSNKNLNFLGFHAHIGSQIFDLKPFVEEIKLLLELTEQYKTEELNIGGGLGVAYLNSDDPPAIADFAREVAAAINGKTKAKLVLEPGRSIISPAGVTLYTIGGIKDIPGIRKYLFVDGGMSDNPRPILYQARYDARLANRATEPTTEKVTIAGRFCESGDILIKDIELPAAQIGDQLVVICTGAYNYAMASNYNRVIRPAMVMVNDGKAKLVLKRESYDDLVRNDIIA